MSERTGARGTWYGGIPWLRRSGLPGADEAVGAQRQRTGHGAPSRAAPDFSGKLVSSADGELTRVAVAWPTEFLQQTFVADHVLVKSQNVDLFEKVFSTLPDACEVLAVTNVFAEEAARELLKQICPREHDVVTISAGAELFVQDPFCPIEPVDDVELVTPIGGETTGPAMIAKHIAAHRSTKRHPSDDAFQGGNVLAGRTHWFLGANSARAILAKREIDPEDINDVAAAYQELGAGRKLILVYTNEDVPAYEPGRVRVDPKEGPKYEELYVGNVGDPLFQPIYHIDLFMTVVLDPDGRDVVLLGSPRLAKEKMERPDAWPDYAALDKALDDVENVIRAQDEELKIVRIPLPMFAVDEPCADTRHWRYASYNNVLLQTSNGGQARKLWLPSFLGTGERAWTDVELAEKEARRIYAEVLGENAEIVQLGDCRSLAYACAGPHCVFNYLARS